MSSEPAIDRAKTALSRNNFSSPVQHLLESGLLHRKRTFFDYGCGRGDDVAGLTELGFAASGWDPAYHPDREQSSADIVNLGFVLNVIEDPKERTRALKRAWELSQKALVVTVISVWERPKNGLEAFADGHVTTRGTFQKYFQPGELKEYVDSTLSLDSLPASPTRVLCFRDPDLEQEYLARADGSRTSAVPPPLHPLRKSRLNQCIERFQAEQPEAWAELRTVVMEFGAPPPPALVSGSSVLTACGIRPADVLSALVEQVGEAEWQALIRRVRNRFLARLALAFFRGKPKAKHYSLLERDAIKHHFSSFASALDEAKQALFSIGDPEIIARECAATDLGIEDEQALYVHRSCLPHLGAVLQAYVGAGRLFFGDLSDVDVFKIHKASGKLTLLLYEDFDTADEPLLHTRVKINYRARRIDYFDHREQGQRLAGKGELMVAG